MPRSERSSIVNQLTQTKFIVQKDRATFVDLVNASALPTFSTNITQQNTEESTVNSQRIQIPISDKEATKTFYISVLKKNKAILQELVMQKHLLNQQRLPDLFEQ